MNTFVVCLLCATLTLATTVAPVEALPGENVPPLPTESFAGAYFVTQQYRDFLGRDPDAAGVAFWADQMSEGLSPGSLIEWFVDSPEFGQSRAPVARLYQAALGRLPDEGGWQFWSVRLAQGEPLEALAALLISTPEGIDRLGSGEADVLIDSLYRNVLGRSPDAAGRSFWTAELESGRSPASVVVAFSESPEFVTAFEPGLQASLLYSGLLDRPAEPGGLQFWTSEIARGRSYASTIEAFINGPEYEQRLRASWCQVITLDDALDWSDGPGQENDRTRLIIHEVSSEIVEAIYDDGFPDEVTTRIIDDKPSPAVFVLGIYEPALEGACLPLLALSSRPDLVRFAPTPLRNSELEATQQAIVELVGPGGWWGIGSGRGRLIVNLSASAVDEADEILDLYGVAIEELTVGSFEYPMPDPLPPTVCFAEPAGTIDPSSIGLEVAVDLPPQVASGGVATGTFTVTNVGAATHTIWWGAEVTAYLGTGATATSSFNGARNQPLTVQVLAPGDSVTGPLDIGTDACDPADGHRLDAGEYTVWGTIPVVAGADPDLSPLDESRHMRLPAQPIELFIG